MAPQMFCIWFFDDHLKTALSTRVAKCNCLANEMSPFAGKTQKTLGTVLTKPQENLPPCDVTYGHSTRATLSQSYADSSFQTSGQN